MGGKKKELIRADNAKVKYSGWLFFLYKVPSKPVNNRMKIWRKLNRAGAVQFKGSAYLLPANDDHLELFNWLVTEVIDLGGEAALIKTDRVENINDEAIVELFNLQRATDYEELDKLLQTLELKINAIQKGSDVQDAQNTREQLIKVQQEFEEIQVSDFFSSAKGLLVSSKIDELKKKLDRVFLDHESNKELTITVKNAEDFQGKTWVTRKRPFVDRMASAWLISRFIDKSATFEFVSDEFPEQIQKDWISFDMKNASFTHVGDLCTFEVLMLIFDLKNKSLKKIGEIVHDLDVKDDKYMSDVAKGLEEILLGIRKSDFDDQTALKKGMNVFELLFASFS